MFESLRAKKRENLSTHKKQFRDGRECTLLNGVSVRSSREKTPFLVSHQSFKRQSSQNDCQQFLKDIDQTGLLNPLPHFDAPKISSCGKHCEKRRHCLSQAISLFLTIFSTQYGTYFSF